MPGSSNDHEHYVSSAEWLVVRGRDDVIDEIADQYERPSCSACASDSDPQVPQAR